jgi:hypothetical protein
MVDYKEIPELIRAFLAASDGTGQRGWDEDTADLAVSYAALVKDANDRLRRCGEYLRRGMRSEAVHLAECQPRLLELAEALRLPNPVAWGRACTAHGSPPPPELLNADLKEIESAFEIERSLEPLLARHRLLALAQSSVQDRQEVLRAIAREDPKNPAWDECLRMLDVARFKEMRLEAKAAFRAHDRAGLERLESELQTHPPRAAVPADLQEGLSKALNSVRVEAARKTLLPLLAQLEAARVARNFEQGNQLLGQWQQAIEANKVVLPAELQQKVSPAIVWLASENQRRNVSQKLQAIQPIIKTGQRDLKTQARNRLALIAAIALCAILVVGAGVWGLIRLLILKH